MNDRLIKRYRYVAKGILFSLVFTPIILSGCSKVEQEDKQNQKYVQNKSEENLNVDVIKYIELPNEQEIMDKVIVLQNVDPSETLEVTIFKQIYDDYGIEQASKYYDEIKTLVSEDDKGIMLTYRSFFNEYSKYNNNDIESLIKQVQNENPLRIEEVTLQDNKLTLVVKNMGIEDIGYFKYDIFYKDTDGDIIDSDWSNCSDTILSDAQCITYTFVEPPTEWNEISVQISEVVFK